MNRLNFYRITFALIALIGAVQIFPNWGLSLIVGGLLLVLYLKELDHRPAILEMAALISALQLLVAPAFMYAFFNQHYRYHMYVPEEIYFGLAIPAVCLFAFGLIFPLNAGREIPAMPTVKLDFQHSGLALVALGFVATAGARFVPGQLGFLCYLLAQMRYVGALYLYFSDYKFRWPIIALAFSALYVTASKYGMFHELLLWVSLAIAYVFLQHKRSLRLKVGYLLMMVVAVSLIQLVKAEFRERLKTSGQTSLVLTAVNVMTTAEDAFGRDWRESMVIRMNQGWLVSKVMETVPLSVDYAGGETIKDAALAAAVPRAFYTTKAKASGRENVNRYTGLRLSKGTSMGLGPLGEGYANFGVYGAMAVMFFFGLLLNFVYRMMCAGSYQDPFFLFCLPVVFLQAIKMETEFLTIFNHLFKSSIVVFGLYYFWVSRSRFFAAQVEYLTDEEDDEDFELHEEPA